ncbi:hypothetical protein CI610_02857 [invertebrate metagenome]|uniref:Serpin domain-containing protein n=1 Tax=invertebrate metagenome TaxID=1711999 RepID=A0A2H9T4S1_9ZZZZ
MHLRIISLFFYTTVIFYSELALPWIIASTTPSPCASKESQRKDTRNYNSDFRYSFIQTSKSFSTILFPEDPKNMVVSTYCYTAALYPLVLGMEGETKKSALEFFNINNSDQDDHFNHYATVAENLQKKRILMHTSAVIIDESLEIHPKYEKKIKDLFGSMPSCHAWCETRRDISAQSFVDYINKTVQTKTNNAIPSLLTDTLDSDTTIVSLSVITLRATWPEYKIPLDKDENFMFNGENCPGIIYSHTLGTRVSLEMGDDKKAVNWKVSILPFEAKKTGVLLAMTDTDQGSLDKNKEMLKYFSFSDFEAQIHQMNCQKLFDNQGIRVHVTLPKLKIETETHINKGTFKKTADGLNHAFNPVTADFTGLSLRATPGSGFYIGNMMQKSILIIDEYGVEAAAATISDMIGGGAPPPYQEWKYNRPFKLYIYSCDGLKPIPLFEATIVTKPTHTP